MNRKHIPAAIVTAGFFFALGIVGAVENGADFSALLWAIPALGMMGVGIMIEKIV